MQAGSYSFNEAGTANYGIWWEAYPRNTMQFVDHGASTFGDIVYVKIEGGLNSSLMTVIDQTKNVGGTYEYSHGDIAQQAEWIEERPSFPRTIKGKKYDEYPYLPRVSTTFFGNGGNMGQNYFKLKDMAPFSTPMTNCSDDTTLAEPGNLATDSSFTVTWKNHGKICDKLAKQQ